jgi:hypothetical protein
MRRLVDDIEYSANFALRYFTGRDESCSPWYAKGFTRFREAMTTAGARPVPTARVPRRVSRR